MGAITSIIGIATGVEYFFASQRDRRTVKFCQDVLVDQCSDEQFIYWSRRRALALRRIEARIAYPIRRYIVPLFFFCQALFWVFLVGASWTTLLTKPIAAWVTDGDVTMAFALSLLSLMIGTPSWLSYRTGRLNIVADIRARPTATSTRRYLCMWFLLSHLTGVVVSLAWTHPDMKIRNKLFLLLIVNCMLFGFVLPRGPANPLDYDLMMFSKRRSDDFFEFPNEIRRPLDQSRVIRTPPRRYPRLVEHPKTRRVGRSKQQVSPSAIAEDRD